jgi:hypothetical protein
MSILDPKLDVGGTYPPTLVLSSEAVLAQLATVAYRLSTWYDSSGGTGYFSGGGTDNTDPNVDTTTAPYGRKCVAFSPSGAFKPYMLSSLNASVYSASSQFTLAMQLYVNSVTTNSATGNLNESPLCCSVANGGFGIFLRNIGGTTPTIFLGVYNGTGWAYTAGFAITLQQWYTAIFVAGGTGTISTSLWTPSGTRQYQQTVSTGGIASLAYKIVLGRNGQAAPAYSDVRMAEVRMYNAYLEANTALSLQYYALAGYYLSMFGTRGDAVSQGQDSGGRRLFFLGAPREEPTISPASLEYLDLYLGDSLAVREDLTAPDPGGAGIADAVWQQREVRLDSWELDLDAMALTLHGQTLNRRLVGYYDDNGRPQVASNRWNEGSSIVLPGGTRRAFGRPSYKWVERCTDGRVARVAPDVEAITPWGKLYEGAAKNHVLHSAFDAAGTGWTLVTDAAHGGTLAATATLASGYDLFDQSVTLYALKFVHGAGGAKADQTATVAAAITTATQNLVVSIDWAITAPSWRLSRTDGKFWNDTSAPPAWQAGSCVNLCAGTANALGIHRHQSTPITGSATNYTLTIVLPAATADGAVCWVEHVQLEERYDAWMSAAISASCATSRIPTTTAAYLRMADTVALGVPVSGQQYLSTICGTMLFLFRPLWSDTDSEPTAIRSFHMDMDVVGQNVRNALWYWPSNAFWNFFDFAGGQARCLAASAHVTRNTWNVVALTWSSAAGENGTKSPTSTLYVNGVKGTVFGRGVSTPLIPQLYSPAILNVNYYGADSCIRRTLIMPRCLSDAEIAAISTSWIAQAVAETPVA